MSDTPLAESEAIAPQRRSLVLLLPIVAFAGLAALFLVRLYAGDPASVPSALIGRPAPAFALPALPGLLADGKPVPALASADLRGQVTVVNVWASWCAPCRVEHPLLMKLAQDKSARLVGIDYKDEAENGRRFLGLLGNPFAAVGADQKGRTAVDWGVYGVPETFIVGRDGTILHKHVGPLTSEAMPGFMAKLREAAAR